jgi:hypothetical protein
MLRAEKDTDLMAGDRRVELKRGVVMFRIDDSGAPAVEIATPNATVYPYFAGVYRIEVKRSGESLITPYGGDVKVSSPSSVEWVPVGKKMIVRGSPADPELRVVSTVSGWRWIAPMLSTMSSSGGVFAGAGGSSSDDDSSSRRSDPPARPDSGNKGSEPRAAHPPPSTQHDRPAPESRPAAVSGRGR